MKGLKVNLGCGTQYREGWVNIDICKKVKADIYGDISEGIVEVEDNSVEVIETRDMIEHIYDKVSTINEMGRMLFPTGTLRIQVPSVNSPAAFQDPTHVSFWNKECFGAQYWTDPPSFLGMRYSFKPQMIQETEPNADGNQWILAEMMKVGNNRFYDPDVKTEWVKMKERIARLESIILSQREVSHA